MKFDVIIPVAGKDTCFVLRVIEYVTQCFDDLDRVYLITNISYHNKLKKKISRYDNVFVLDEDKLVDGLSIKSVEEKLNSQKKGLSSGWFFQQFLKYAFSLTEYANKYYLSWDADTLPLSHIKFFEDNHPYFTRKYEYNENYFKTIKNLLGINKTAEFSFIAEHMMFDPIIVKHMLSEIQHSAVEGETWFEKIINAGDYSYPLPTFSEFETYGTFVFHYYPNLYKTRQLNTFRFGGYIQGRNISDKKLREISFDTDTISFELCHDPLFPYNFPNICARLEKNIKLLMRLPIKDICGWLLHKIKKDSVNAKQREEFLKTMTRL